MKNRTIPQLELRELSGDCTVFLLDSVTASYVKKLWGLVEFPSTFTLYGKTKAELYPSITEFVSLKNAIEFDFEKGSIMTCDIIQALNAIAEKIESISVSASASAESAKLSALCCGQGGNGETTGTTPGSTDVIPAIPPDSSNLCKIVKYADYLAQGYFDKWIAPLAGVTLDAVLTTLGASLAIPPYGTEIVEVAIAIIAGAAGLGLAVLIDNCADGLSAVFQQIYCELSKNYPLEQTSFRNWFTEKLDQILDTYGDTVKRVVLWAINASGAMGALVDGINDLISIPDIGNPAICDCPLGVVEG